MATRVLRRLISKTLNKTLTPRSFSSSTSTTTKTIFRIRPLISVVAGTIRHTTTTHAFCTSSDDDQYSNWTTSPSEDEILLDDDLAFCTSSDDDQYSNWSTTCPPEEKVLLDGCDFEHWFVVVEKPEGEPTRDEIIESYINILAKAVGSYDDARMKIYSVSTRCYYAFGALLSEEDTCKLKELPGVHLVLPDSYMDVENKDYGGEPFINGKAVPYDPKYHEEWIRENARRNKRQEEQEEMTRNG